MANISQADIPASNGLFHHVDGLLLPMHINYLLPSRCDTQESEQVTVSSYASYVYSDTVFLI